MDFDNRQIEIVRQVVPLARMLGEDPYVIIAIGHAETNLKPWLKGRGDYGMMQIHCAAHEKDLRYFFGIKYCYRAMMDLHLNVLAAAFILEKMRSKYPRICGGDELFACYNGGPGWRVRMKQCEETKKRPICDGAVRYRDKVVRRIKFLREHYRELIESL